jgi:hypothetical protein
MFLIFFSKRFSEVYLIIKKLVLSVYIIKQKQL